MILDRIFLARPLSIVVLVRRTTKHRRVVHADVRRGISSKSLRRPHPRIACLTQPFVPVRRDFVELDWPFCPWASSAATHVSITFYGSIWSFRTLKMYGIHFGKNSTVQFWTSWPWRVSTRSMVLAPWSRLLLARSRAWISRRQAAQFVDICTFGLCTISCKCLI